MSANQFQKILDKYRSKSYSERDKGTRFERLMQAFLQSYPLYKNKLKHVWLWEDFPCKQSLGGIDMGIDLVAYTYEGDYWAIQCKCYAADTVIDKPAVDTFVTTSSRSFMDEDGIERRFSFMLWIDTTEKGFNSNAEQSITNQFIPFSRFSLVDLLNAEIDWDELEKGITGDAVLTNKKTVRPHQETAIEKAHEYFKTNDRGKLIMACGTGKTFTSLKIAEKETDGKGTILFLVPSIALLGQTLREWSYDAEEKINAICICSDADVSKIKRQKDDDTDGFSITELAMPASTNADEIKKQYDKIKRSKEGGMTVFFSTYQSVDKVAEAQEQLGDDFVFDLMVCDEAHRTTGVTLKDEIESNFVSVHDNDYLKAKKRLYMTATPRIYAETAQVKARENDAVLCSMDDVAYYGNEIYRIGFGEAVEKQLLSDYKVLVLTLSDEQVSEDLQLAIAGRDSEIKVDDAAKLIGCINALSKRTLLDAKLLKEVDAEPMRRAVAFCQNISISKRTSSAFNSCNDAYFETLTPEERAEMVNVEAKHVDGSMGATTRDLRLQWLKDTPNEGNKCRILTNVRCLSEGVDVPSLDAVLFLSARNSQVDVVQSVGRVMRRAEGKKYGYIIIPVVIPSDIKPEDALDDNERFKVVWTVLNALRAHDDRFNATINKIELNKRKPSNILVGGTMFGGDNGDTEVIDRNRQIEEQLSIKFEGLQSIIFARMVQKVGDKRYWEQWAADVAKIAERHIKQIKKLIETNEKARKTFDTFLNGLHKNINPSVSEDTAIEMLAQHIITQPVFEALFENYSFAQNNPMSRSLSKMIGLLNETIDEEDVKSLERFYKSVRQRAEGIDNAEAKQKIIVELYDKFFKTAFPKVVEQLGIVYTPVECVDFIIQSVEKVLQKEFGRSISDERVNVIDPFTGTGTFITRLLQSGIIKKEDLERKYKKEISANEFVLLAYYIASINIENAYHDLIDTDEYTPFNGICLTDTFQLGEQMYYKKAVKQGVEIDDASFAPDFPENSARIRKQLNTPITVIIGNPPYSVGQKSANDNAQNQSYPRLENRIGMTYAAKANTTNKNSLYDSYIKAFRWASDRLNEKEGGVIGFISNGAWIDSNVGEGFRKSLETEFSSVYVFNLRGNQRTSGELSRKEGGKIFGSGSRTPIAITILVKKPNWGGKAKIFYHDIGDYLSREEKLSIVAKSGDIFSLPMVELRPNEHGDWINQRNDLFTTFIPIEPQKKQSNSFFNYYSMGLGTSRDVWTYSFGKKKLEANIDTFIRNYNEMLSNGVDIEQGIIDPRALNISRKLKRIYSQKKVLTNSKDFRVSLYRPYVKQNVYFDNSLNEYTYSMPNFFPKNENNFIICLSIGEETKGIRVLITDKMPDSHTVGDCQCFPLYYYTKNQSSELSLFGNNTDEYLRQDAISDFILRQAQSLYGLRVNKEDLFYYVYGFLHSPEYRTTFEADLKKMLPRIPLVENAQDFWAFSKAGRELATLHLNYETVEPYDDVRVECSKDEPSYYVEKMRFPNKEDKSIIQFNPHIRITNIPSEAYEYIVNGKSAIEWIMERYAISTDKASGIVNNPNDWAAEHGNPKYIFDLLLSVINVSVKTIEIVKGLPKISFD